MIEGLRKKISIMSSQNNYDFFKICPASAESNPYMHLVVKKNPTEPLNPLEEMIMIFFLKQ